MVHRLGRMLVGETSVAVIVTAAHRAPRVRSRPGGHQPAQEDRSRSGRRNTSLDGEVWVEGEWDDHVPSAAITSALAGWWRFCGCACLAQRDRCFKVDVNLVHVIATVKNQTGQTWSDPHQERFRDLDNGARQEISVFERQADQPLSVALLIDTSGSTAKDLKFESRFRLASFLHVLLAEGNPRGLRRPLHFQLRHHANSQPLHP